MIPPDADPQPGPVGATAPVPLLLLISAPSGAGKTTLCDHLLAEVPGLTRAITCTTRPPRAGEEPGVHYHFLNPEEFEARVQAGDFLEHATVYGNRYGTLKLEVLQRLRAGRDVLLNVDVQGAATVRDQAARDPELKRSLVTVFVTTPSVLELERRLAGRGQDSPEVIQRRLAEARRELAAAPRFDYLIVSGSREEDQRRVLAIYEAERVRSHRTPVPQF